MDIDTDGWLVTYIILIQYSSIVLIRCGDVASTYSFLCVCVCAADGLMR